MNKVMVLGFKLIVLCVLFSPNLGVHAYKMYTFASFHSINSLWENIRRSVVFFGENMSKLISAQGN